MQKARSGVLAATAALIAALVAPAPAQARPAPAAPQAAGESMTPYDPGTYTDLYQKPNGPITGSTYIFNPTANFPQKIAYDFAHMRDIGVNTIGFYNLVQMTDADRDVIFDNLEKNHQKAVVRIEWYDGATFDFDDGDADHTDAKSVIDYYDSDDPAHGYTALLDYLIRKDRLPDVAYFAVNMPVDDGTVTNHFATAQYPNGRDNPEWAASQPPYADYLLAHLRSVLGGAGAAKLYLSVFYGWDQSYRTPSYAGIAHPADGYFFNNYSYPAGDPPDENASTSVRINQPRLQRAMDLMMSQYPTQPKVIEYGFHTVEFNNGVPPAQTAGLVRTMAAKRLALPETTAFYQNGSSDGRPFNVRGTLYFAQNLYKEEGNPPALMDWTLDYPATGQVEAEDTGYTRSYEDGRLAAPCEVHASTASGGRAVALRHPGSALAFYDLAASSMVRVRYRSARPVRLLVSVNGATPRAVRFPAAPRWRTRDIALNVPIQGSVMLRTAGHASAVVDWLRPVAGYAAELAATRGGTTYTAADATDGGGMLLPGGRASWLAFAPVRGGSAVTVRYAAAGPVTTRLAVGRDTYRLDLPATGGATTYATHTLAVTVPSGSPLRLARDGDGGDLRVDDVRVDGQYEIESVGGLYNGAHAVARRGASEGAAATDFDVVGASAVVDDVIKGGELTFGYAATRDTSMTVIMNGHTYPIDFPDTGGRFAQVRLSADVPAGTTVIVQRNPGNDAAGLTLDWMRVSG